MDIKAQLSRWWTTELEPGVTPELADLNLAGVDAACPHGLPVADLLKTADRRLGLV